MGLGWAPALRSRSRRRAKGAHDPSGAYLANPHEHVPGEKGRTTDGRQQAPRSRRQLGPRLLPGSSGPLRIPATPGSSSTATSASAGRREGKQASGARAGGWKRGVRLD